MCVHQGIQVTESDARDALSMAAPFPKRMAEDSIGPQAMHWIVSGPGHWSEKRSQLLVLQETMVMDESMYMHKHMYTNSLRASYIYIGS
mgnify:CR=1 FL=1|jgi:hypothetical protein